MIFTFSYCTLIMGSILVYIFPSLSCIGSHGKLENDRRFDKTTILSFITKLRVPKSYFIHMYILGLCINTIFILNSIKYTLLTKLTDLDNINENLKVKSNYILILILFELHTVRRLYECCFLTIYGNSTIHFGGYLCGLFHYMLTPICFHYNVLLNYNFSNFIFRFISIYIYLLSSYGQYRTHEILYNLKLENMKKIDEKEIKSKKNKIYSIPKGLLFQYVCCPHYFQEICIYLSFFLLQPTSLPMLCLLLWVISNLAVSSNNQFKWYKHHYNSKDYPTNWKKLIPFVW